MDTKLKNTEIITDDTLNKGEETTGQVLSGEEEENKKLPPRKGSIRYKMNAKWIRVLIFIITGFLAAYACLAVEILSSSDVMWDISAAIEGDEQPMYRTDTYMMKSGSVYTTEIERLYTQLYMAASGAMRYKYNLDYEYLSRLNNEMPAYSPDDNIWIDIYSEDKGVKFDSDKLDYYVAFGDTYSTNVPGLGKGATYEALKSKFDSLDDHYYIRIDNKIVTGGKDTGNIFSPAYTEGVVTGGHKGGEPRLALGKSYYDEDTKIHIFDNTDLYEGYYTYIYEDDEYLYNDDGTESFYEPEYNRNKKYIYDEKAGNYVYAKTLQPLDDSKIVIAIAVRPSGTDYAVLRASDNEQLEITKVLIISGIAVAAVLFVLVMILVIKCGYNRDTGTFTPTRVVDKRSTSEIFLFFIIASLVVTMIVTDRMAGNMPVSFERKALIVYAAVFAGYFGLWTIGFGSVLIVLRKLKTGTLMSTSLIVKAVRRIFRLGKKAAHKVGEDIDHTSYGKLTVSRKFLVRNIIFGVLTGFMIVLMTLAIVENWPADEMGLVEIGLTIYAVYFIWYFLSAMDFFHDAEKLCRKLDAVGMGVKYDGEPMSKTSPFFNYFKGLDSLDEQIKKQADEMVKSEKTKVELVTNVSHDLKTPLTSIISYIYLLDQEEMSNEAKDYVKVLKVKSEKLKSIVNDVFSLAKAASGAEIKDERLDLTMLINQTIASNQDVIDKVGITLKTDIPDKNVYIMGDGDKISRVFQNLFDNAMKYSLKGTRVFIEMKAGLDSATVAFKNTSAYEMNFTADEITERFARGDKSRTDGGSGLGLSIAKTFTEACGGSFSIELEGDMFKALVSFKTVE